CNLAPSRTGVIRASTRSADFLTDWTSARQFSLLNIPETLTHYPHNGNQPTIPDLTFARNHAYTLTQGWASDEGEGGDSDHTLITTTLNIKAPKFTPDRQYYKANWDLFKLHMTKMDITED
ncbi:hypothetical protein Q9L58_010827, partial [Maublancomyces gigas]